MTHSPQQSGVALITALLITALVTVVAVAMATRQQLDIRRTGNMLEADQAYLYGLAGETTARQVLIEDRENSTIDALDEAWTTPLPLTLVEGGAVTGQIEDLNRYFNLNNLVDSSGVADPNQIKALQRILEYLNRSVEGLDLSPFIANRVVDWIDVDLNAEADGAEDLEYLAESEGQVPYRTANRAMASPSELLAIAGLQDQDARSGAYELLKYVTALPPQTRININTASKPVLMSIHPSLDENAADDIISMREEEAFEDVMDFSDLLANSYDIQLDADYVSQYLSVDSDYFLSTVNASIGRTDIILYSVLRRQNNVVTTVSRSVGVL